MKKRHRYQVYLELPSFLGHLTSPVIQTSLALHDTGVRSRRVEIFKLTH